MNNSINITTTMNWIISTIYDLISFIYIQMNRIQFGGTTLFKFVIGIAIIGAILPILLTFPKQAGKMVSERKKPGKTESKRKK